MFRGVEATKMQCHDTRNEERHATFTQVEPHPGSSVGLSRHGDDKQPGVLPVAPSISINDALFGLKELVTEPNFSGRQECFLGVAGGCQPNFFLGARFWQILLVGQ